MRILLITPPMVQVNAPYPATAYLAGFLREHGYEAAQADASLELALRLFSRRGIAQIRKALRPRARGAAVRHFRQHADAYAATVDSTLRFLQGKDPTLAIRIASRAFLPEGPRFARLDRESAGASDPLEWAFGHMGTQDLAVHLASLYLDDLTDAIHDGIDARFELARYGEKLAASAPSFEGLAKALRRKPTLIDTMIDDLADDLVRTHAPDLVGFTLPFPGNVYAAFRMARRMKRSAPGTVVVMGGGYVNTELRALADPAVFDAADYILLDDGETPLLRLIQHLENRNLPLIQLIEHSDGQHPADGLVRTFARQGDRVVFRPDTPAVPRDEPGSAPVYDALPLDRYFSMFEMPNPMHRLWSGGRWNKLVLARGCYWHRCAFCDTALDYIAGYRALPVDRLAGQIRAIIAQTGQSGFHFVDEAMPPAMLRQLAEHLIEHGPQITWWGNIRFDKAFTPDLADCLARSGCVAVTGGLEAATDRLLTLMNKGFTLDQVMDVTQALAQAGIMVHAYLMYGCPSQTLQETIDALEFVRRLFVTGRIQSAYWHRFALTVHSPIYRDPAAYGIRLVPQPPASFARNEAPFEDPTDCDHDALGRGLRAALYNYMHGVGFDLDLQSWFAIPVPPPSLTLTSP